MIKEITKTIQGVKYQSFMIYNGVEFIFCNEYGDIMAITNKLVRNEDYTKVELIFNDKYTNWEKQFTKVITEFETYYAKHKKVIFFNYKTNINEDIPAQLQIKAKWLTLDINAKEMEA